MKSAFRFVATLQYNCSNANYGKRVEYTSTGSVCSREMLSDVDVHVSGAPTGLGVSSRHSSVSSRKIIRKYSTRSTLTMKDKSSAYWFQTGDSVRVLDVVFKAGTSLKGRSGIVVETWEKCNVDPTCCCAEQVDPGMAVRVEFQGTETNSTESGSFMHYFAEEELTHARDDDTSKAEQAQPFNGLSCTAFKLDQLKMGQQAKRIAAYEQSQSDQS